MTRRSALLRVSWLALAAFAGLLGPRPAVAENWPGWRGPRGDGTSEETGLPVSWSATENVIWKKPLGTFSTSSPIVWGGKVFITAQVGRGPRQRIPVVGYRVSAGVVERTPEHDLRFYLLALSAADGSALWAQQIDPGKKLIPVGPGHNLAMPTPVTDGSRVYTLFGTGVLTCFDVNGRGLWQRHLEEDYAPFDVIYGHASSPVLHDDKIIVLADHAPGSYVVALNKFTGETVWKYDREAMGPSYSTPVVIDFGSGSQLVVAWSLTVGALDLNTGRRLWLQSGLGIEPVSSPVYDGGVLYANGGSLKGPIMALRPPSAGSEGTAPEVLWQLKRGSPYVSSFVLADKKLFSVEIGGFARCIDATDGTQLWKGRLRGDFYASPIAAEGRIYAINDEGETFVFEAADTFKVVSSNPLGERSLATPAFSGGRIFIRTDEHLYCIGAEPGAASLESN